MKRLLVLLLIILRETGPTSSQQPTCHSSCPLSFCNCRDVGLNGVPQFLPTNITYLTLYGNEITTLREYEFSRYRSLLTLHLGYNQISSISNNAFYGLTILRDLRLFGNRLTSVLAYMFEGLDNLEILNLHHNGMNSIEAGTFNSTPKLQTLDLRHNRISTIAPDTFANLPQFSSLDLSNNMIYTFPVALLSNLSMLSNLDMEDNEMETLPPEAYGILASVSITNLGSNPWQCDCRMLPFKQRMTGSHLFEFQITCAGPASLQGKSLLHDVNAEDLICEQTTVTVSPSPSTSSPVVHPGASTSIQTPSTTLTTHSTTALSTVSPSSSSDTGEKSTSTVSTSSPTPRAHTTSGLSTVSTSPSFDQPGMSIKPSSTQTASTTHLADSTPVLSTVSTSSSDSPESPRSPTTPEYPVPAGTHVPPQLTDGNAGPPLVFISMPVYLSGLLSAAVVTLLICSILITVKYLCKRRTRKTLSGQDSDACFTNTNLPALDAVTSDGQIQKSGQRYLVPSPSPPSAMSKIQRGQGRNTVAALQQAETPHKGMMMHSYPSQRSQPGQRQNLYRAEKGYQVPCPLPPSGSAAGTLDDHKNESVAALGADANHYEPLRKH
ncbi:PREDICTED: SLIT and NTRK-like protein 1 [Branchiostoma belcheri]|uniref:SLIT and NTRK-like protein 1 n=1 Tax=Branchiostoma belcheri TaxID=7741 RepID=A0A6P5AZY4_BRABE|nr:PREDICTED: SLIT and NTRK-like protein 1 [Branchiostoma belcheri]